MLREVDSTLQCGLLNGIFILGFSFSFKIVIYRNGEYDRLAHIHANIQQVFGIRNIVSMINTKSPSAKAPSAHSGPAFLPWHREYVKRFDHPFACFYSFKI